MKPIQRSITVMSSVEHAFDVFTTSFAQWWPQCYTLSNSSLDTIVLIPRQGGRWYERGVHGRECDWGEILLWDPPRRLMLSFRISPDRLPETDPDRSSEIDIKFSPESEVITRIEFEHRGFERHGTGGEMLRAALDSGAGWSGILECYANTAVSPVLPRGGDRNLSAGPSMIHSELAAR